MAVVSVKLCSCLMRRFRYVQFSIRVGSRSSVGSCARPDSDNELVLVQYTCNGGVDWQLLQLIDISDKYTQPMYVISSLSAGASRFVSYSFVQLYCTQMILQPTAFTWQSYFAIVEISCHILRLPISFTWLIFTVRRYALHGLCDRNSVCLSVTLVDCVHMVRGTIMISSPYGSPIILVSGDITFISA